MDNDFRVTQFEKFYELLMKSAPEGYAPWFFPCDKNGKNPCTEAIKKINPTSYGSWHHPSARLSKEQAIKLIKQGYNIGISARKEDPLIIGDIDNPAYLNQLPKDTLTSVSRKRVGAHFFGWNKDGTAKINLSTSDDGEIRSDNEYVLAVGSYVPFNLNEKKDKEIYDALPKEAKEDKFFCYYTLGTEVPPRPLAFIDFPTFFQNKQREETEGQVKAKQREEVRDYPKEGKYTELLNLKVSDIVGLIPKNKRQGHPLHASDTDANFSLSSDGSLAHCWRHMVSLNAVQYLCVQSGYASCEDAGTPHKGRGISKIRGDKNALESAYKEAKKCGLIKENIPVKKELPPLEIYSDADIINYVPEKQAWLIENQIPKGEIGILAGKRGDKKTWVALYQAICLASGKDCFGDKVPEKKRVLFLDEESGKDSIATRVKLIKNGLRITEPLDIKFLSFSGIKLDDISSNKFFQLINAIRDFKPHLIYADCLQRFISFESDKENAMISELLTSIIRPLIKEIGGATWTFIHHMRKGNNQNKGAPEDPLDEVRGGSELVNYCRFVLMTQTPRNQTKSEDGGDLFIFKVLKMSNAEIPEPKVLCFKPKEDGITIEYAGTPEETLATEVRVANAILGYLFEKQIFKFETSKITAAEKEIGFKRSLISLGLGTLVKQGKLKRVKRGIYEMIDSEIEPSQTKLAQTKEKEEEFADLDLGDEDE